MLFVMTSMRRPGSRSEDVVVQPIWPALRWPVTVRGCVKHWRVCAI